VATKVKTSCCRSSPRCAGCPVVLAAGARRQVRVNSRAALVEEVLVGRCTARRLPEPVERALPQLVAARGR
jgi:hypothetical protein